MAALRAYPDPDTETTTVDGYVQQYNGGTSNTWATFRDGSGSSATDNATTANPIIQSGTTTTNFRAMGRTIYLFDTSAISTDTISSTILSLYTTATNNTGGFATSYLDMYTVSSAPASNTGLVAADYTTLGTTNYASIGFTSFVTSAYNDFTFSDFTLISKTGITKLGQRFKADADDTDPSPGASGIGNTTVTNYMAEQTGTLNDPVLYVTHGTDDDTVASFYPDPSVETTTVDGDMFITNASWDTAHDSTTSTAADSATTILIRSALTGGSTYNIYRAVTGFDTSSVGTDTVSEAEVSLSVNEVKDEEPTDSQSYIAAVGATLASNTAVASGDFDGIGDAVDNPTKWSADIDLGSLTTTQYQFNTIPLNATGISNINGSGVTNIGWREGHDIEDTVGGLTTAGDESHYWAQSADFAGTANDPVLVVSHGAAAASTFTPKVMFF